MAPFNRPPGQPSKGRHIGYGGKATAEAAASRRGSGKDWKNKGDPDYNKRWDVKTRNEIEKRIREAGSDAGTMFKDVVKDPTEQGLGWLAKQVNRYLPFMAMRGLTRGLEENKAASRDYDIPFYKGGNPLAVDQRTPADIFLRGDAEGLTPLVKDFPAYNEALKKDRLFWQNLDEMTDNNYEAKAGYLALLNDPSRLDKMENPVRALNYMRSITGDPTNMGFDEFEAWRQAKGRTEKERGLTATQIAQQLLPQYRQQAAEMYGEGFLGNTAAANYGDTSTRDIMLDQNVPYKDEYVDQFDIAENLSQYQRYLLQSQAQGRGGHDLDPLGALTNAGFDPDYLGSQYPKMKLSRYGLEEEEEEQGVPFYQ
jgi:hypothetical protein